MLYGNHVGSLRVNARHVGGEEEIPPLVEWETEGNQGKNWHQGHITIDGFYSFNVRR